MRASQLVNGMQYHYKKDSKVEIPQFLLFLFFLLAPEEFCSGKCNIKVPSWKQKAASSGTKPASTLILVLSASRTVKK
jgi:hypothetical protein